MGFDEFFPAHQVQRHVHHIQQGPLQPPPFTVVRYALNTQIDVRDFREAFGAQNRAPGDETQNPGKPPAQSIARSS